jgi:chromosome segregation ATPase
MKLQETVVRPPKTRQAALNQAAALLISQENLARRHTNMAQNIQAAKDKILKLQGTIEELEKQSQILVESGTATQAQIAQLKLQHQLNEAEILEAKSELLRSQITNLEKNLGLQVRQTVQS